MHFSSFLTTALYKLFTYLLAQLVEVDSDGVAVGDNQRYCGSDVPASWSSAAERVMVTFRTNRRGSAAGFSLNFTAGQSHTTPNSASHPSWNTGDTAVPRISDFVL